MEDKAGEACGNNPELRENPVKLVQAGQEGTEALDTPFIQLAQPLLTHFGTGEIILGRFRIVRPIGSGGMGDVYEAEDLQLGRVALKTIRQDIASSSEAFSRFRQEVQLARKISGSQVCRIHELYLIPADRNHSATAFLTMEYLDGITLAQRLKAGGPLPLKQAQAVALDICEGLRLVHAKGVIHRDLKSANIMLCGEGESMRAVLMDFGLARDSGIGGPDDQTAAVAGTQGGTFPGAIMGTPAYMAPEQFEGKTVSSGTDIYALGIVLYELVTGLHPYAAPTPVAAAIRRAQRPAPPSSFIHSVPRKWDRIIQQCLQFEPAERFQSAEEVAKALRAGPANIGNLRKDRPLLFRVACVLAGAGLAWGIFNLWQTRQYYHPGPEALSQYNNGLALIRQGNYAEATRVLQAALGQDKHFVMAHARLAEAWYNLDFQGNAQQELLIALPERDRLPALDRKYLDAIHATVTGDSSGALADYKQILDDLPSSEKSSGYVDLGMAYERAGDIPHSLGSYSQAAGLDGNNPAAYMHTGILQSRLHHVQEGEQAFARAQAIFGSEIDSYGRAGNPEGMAELDYERGYAANVRGDSVDAEPLLKRSVNEAAKIPSIQLQIRALSQLSSAASADSNDDVALNAAQQAIDLARDNQLESWAANGLVRLAAAKLYLEPKHWPEAERSLGEAFEILRSSPQPRVEALANSTLASLMSQEHQTDKVAEPAQKALDYYRRNGFAEGARSVSILLMRNQRDKGQYKEAMESGEAVLNLATQSGQQYFRYLAEEAVGTVAIATENYEGALAHFQKAKELASNVQQRSLQQVHCADALWRMGHDAEAEVQFKLAASDTRQDSVIGLSRVEFLISHLKYQPALALVLQVQARNPDMPSDRRLELEQQGALARAHAGLRQQALAGLAASVVPAFQAGNPADAAQARLVAADIDLALGNPSQAFDAALAAEDYFASSAKLDSELRSASLAAAAAKLLHNETGFSTQSQNVLDIIKRIQQNWGPDSSRIFFSRPDIHFIKQRSAKTVN